MYAFESEMNIDACVRMHLYVMIINEFFTSHEGQYGLGVVLLLMIEERRDEIIS